MPKSFFEYVVRLLVSIMYKTLNDWGLSNLLIAQKDNFVFDAAANSRTWYTHQIYIITKWKGMNKIIKYYFKVF